MHSPDSLRIAAVSQQPSLSLFCAILHCFAANNLIQSLSLYLCMSVSLSLTATIYLVHGAKWPLFISFSFSPFPELQRWSLLAYLSIYLTAYLLLCLSGFFYRDCLPACLSVYIRVCLSPSVSVGLLIQRLSLPAYMSVCLSPSVYVWLRQSTVVSTAFSKSRCFLSAHYVLPTLAPSLPCLSFSVSFSVFLSFSLNNSVQIDFCYIIPIGHSLFVCLSVYGSLSVSASVSVSATVSCPFSSSLFVLTAASKKETFCHQRHVRIDRQTETETEINIHMQLDRYRQRQSEAQQ